LSTNWHLEYCSKFDTGLSSTGTSPKRVIPENQQQKGRKTDTTIRLARGGGERGGARPEAGGQEAEMSPTG
jgi:hypothetical protein